MLCRVGDTSQSARVLSFSSISVFPFKQSCFCKRGRERKIHRNKILVSDVHCLYFWCATTNKLTYGKPCTTSLRPTSHHTRKNEFTDRRSLYYSRKLCIFILLFSLHLCLSVRDENANCPLLRSLRAKDKHVKIPNQFLVRPSCPKLLSYSIISLSCSQRHFRM